MKGFVFSLALPRTRRQKPDLKRFLHRYGLYALFAGLLLLGLALGAVYARNADKGTLRALDLLFTTNLDARLSQSPVGTFCACFASDFLFLLGVFLLGAAAWGIPFLAALVCFKGFGTGVTAGWLCVCHALRGAGFYLLVLLPGTFVFCTALIGFAGAAHRFSARQLWRFVGRAQPPLAPKEELARFGSRFVSALGVTFLASLLDTLLWTLFAGTFTL